MRSWLSRNVGRLVLLLLALLLFGWVLSGDDNGGEVDTPERSTTVKVGLTGSHAESVERVLQLQGQAEPEQVVRVRAKTGGEVAETPVEEGAVVEADQLLARLTLDDRPARLSEAKAAERRAQGDYDAASRLADQGFQARLAAERARAELEAARARVAAIELDIEHTAIPTPIAGVLNRQIARVGDVVAAGEPVAEIVENNPLRAVVRIPQHRIHEVEEGQAARVTFLDGQVREGTVRYVSTVAEDETRTFRARVEVANPDRNLPSGTSVTVEIPVEEVRAHAISPALISQSESGELGVKIAVDGAADELEARFVPVTPIRADAEQVWVTGLDDTVRLISLGQGFVRDGDVIEVVPTAEGER
ncbi:efflux RND transporter periplasmic adaptor subunit [Guyparkeria hydrothermalis]|uniref:efflux RND transporter periplasmic adaptor subunit n=1 Tax=Guyparkeria TaxID=2035712 RepID=UPI0010AB9789|nr:MULTISPECIES: efflux RND transporter periplasmic adaptor subunit [Guyparkeria]MCL7750420.1 efflux RND transporter periplasmic adaptor subunit [Guyparkeria hydrothermalis]TKA91064.1 efflux RND transporter periplasmic adaptor subunit [Guyparkeria sp. SB14A]